MDISTAVDPATDQEESPSPPFTPALSAAPVVRATLGREVGTAPSTRHAPSR